MRTLDHIAFGDDNTCFVLRDRYGCPQLLWQENRIGRLLRIRSGREWRVPYFTGVYRTEMRSHNLITNVGHAAANARLSDQGSYAAFTNIAVGTGSVAAAAADTALGAEVTTGGAGRGAATATQVTTTVTNDTTQLVKTFTFGTGPTYPLAITEEGIFDNATSGGNLLARQTFAAINVNNGDSLQITHKITT